MMSVLYIGYQRYGTYSDFQRSQNEPVLVSEASSTGSHHPPIEQSPQTLYTQSIPHYRRGYQSPLSLYDQETWRQILPLEKKAPQLE